MEGHDKGISRRAAFLGAVLLVLVTAAATLSLSGLVAGGGTAGVRIPGEGLAAWREVKDSPAFHRFLAVMAIVQRNYVEKPDLEKMLEGAADGAVAALDDPYSAFFTARAFANFHAETDGKYGGIGVQITERDREIVVVAAFPGTPGADTPFEGAGPEDPRGLLPGDRIVAVDGKEVSGWPAERVADAIRGEPSTVVVVRVVRTAEGRERELTFRLRRARISVPSTRADASLAPGVGYLQITQFLEDTPEKVRADLASLRRQGARVLIVDLRHNPGGRLDVAVNVAGQLVPAGPVVHVVDRSGRRETLYSHNRRGLGMPVVVLVDEATASAAEILAAALQERAGAVLVGKRTFGKGLVQQVWSLDGGTGLKLTVAKYLTPKGRDINRRRQAEEGAETGGLIPDVVVERPPELPLGDRQRDPQLRKALELARQRLGGRAVAAR